MKRKAKDAISAVFFILLVVKVTSIKQNSLETDKLIESVSTTAICSVFLLIRARSLSLHFSDPRCSCIIVSSEKLGSFKNSDARHTGSLQSCYKGAKGLLLTVLKQLYLSLPKLRTSP